VNFHSLFVLGEWIAAPYRRTEGLEKTSNMPANRILLGKFRLPLQTQANQREKAQAE
jgi:hypothetical protein